mgnify:CR=1 FL=1
MLGFFWKVINSEQNATIFTELSPLNVFFIMDACLGHILESTKYIEMKLLLDRWQ